MTNQKTPEQGGPTTGWHEFILDGAVTTHIAYVYEDGSIYFPEGPDVVDESAFRLASAAGRVFPLVRAEDHAATVTGDRVRDVLVRIAEMYSVRDVPEWETYSEIHEMVAALAAPVEVDEAKLAEVLDDHSRYVMVTHGANECGCGVPVGPVKAWNEHKARAVTDWLRGEGR